MEEFINVFKNFTNVSGRTSRREYIIANLVQSAICIAFAVYEIIMVGLFNKPWIEDVLESIYWIYTLFAMLPFFTLSVRRLHDTGRSGFNILWSAIPIIGTIVVFVFLLEKTRNEDNKYTDEKKKNRIFIIVLWLVLSVGFYFGILKDDLKILENDLDYIVQQADYYGYWQYEEYVSYKQSDKDTKPGFVYSSIDLEIQEGQFYITRTLDTIERNNNELTKTHNLQNYASGTVKKEDDKVYLKVENSDIENIIIDDELECSIDDDGNLILNIPNTNESYTLTVK